MHLLFKLSTKSKDSRAVLRGAISPGRLIFVIAWGRLYLCLIYYHCINSVILLVAPNKILTQGAELLDTALPKVLYAFTHSIKYR